MEEVIIIKAEVKVPKNKAIELIECLNQTAVPVQLPDASELLTEQQRIDIAIAQLQERLESHINGDMLTYQNYLIRQVTNQVRAQFDAEMASNISVTSQEVQE